MSARRAAVVSLAACGIAACNAIFGVDSFVVSGPTGGAATASSTGSHSSSGSGGSISWLSTSGSGTGAMGGTSSASGSSSGSHSTGGSGTGGTVATISASASSSESSASGSSSESSASASSGGPCLLNQALCGGQCVDVSSDPLNCGACGNVCASGVCGTTISASMATLPTLWRFNGVAQYNAGAQAVTLTANADDIGTIIYQNAVETDSFVLSFDFQIIGSLGEGMAFMIETTGNTAVGSGNGGLGIAGLTGYGFELDTRKETCSDPNANHVGVDALTPCSAGSSLPKALTASASPIALAGSGWQTCKLSFANGTVTMVLGPTSVIASYSIPGWQSGQAYYFGFAGDSGAKAVTQQVRNVTLKFPTTRCL